jgi:hypothetical protein
MLPSIAPLFPSHPRVIYHCQKCDTSLSANSVNLKDIISRYEYIYIYTISNNQLNSTSEDIILTVSLLLCSWTRSNRSFCVFTVSTLQFQTCTVCTVLVQWVCCAVRRWTWYALCLFVSSNRQQYALNVRLFGCVRDNKYQKWFFYFLQSFLSVRLQVTTRDILNAFSWNIMFGSWLKFLNSYQLFFKI